MTLAQANNESLFDTDSIDLNITDIENAMHVYQDKRNNWCYNLNTNIRIVAPESILLTYTCTYDSHWPLISYQLYGTTRLAWLLMQINNVKAKDMFKPILASESVKYIDKSYIRNIINILLTYNYDTENS